MSQELLPCPFCGSQCDPSGWSCTNGQTGPECEGCGATAESAEAWNRRAQPERKLTDELPPLPFSPYLCIDWKDKQNSTTLYTADQMREYARALLAAQPAAATVPDIAALPFAILPDEMSALQRFHECAMDGEGYDGPKEMMLRLAEIGLVSRLSANYYEETTFGLSVLNGDFTAAQAQDDGEKK